MEEDGISYGLATIERAKKEGTGSKKMLSKDIIKHEKESPMIGWPTSANLPSKKGNM